MEINIPDVREGRRKKEEVIPRVINVCYIFPLRGSRGVGRDVA
ncbi:hypothetical protein [Okeania sp. SIO2C2]|nr:hypothetical protein [Okeania sp. SIO2C2]